MDSKVIFLDTNILIDLLCHRQYFNYSSNELWGIS